MPPLPAYDPTGVEYYSIPGFQFTTGEKLDVEIAYREFNKGAARVILIPTCFGGKINTTLTFTNGALKDYRVIVVAMLGNGESTSPSHTAAFPKAQRYMDNINAQYQLLTQHLNIASLEAVVGFSMGGQQAYHWAVRHGSGPSPFLKNAVCICTSAKTSGHNIAFLEGPICSLEHSGDYAAYRREIEAGTEPGTAFKIARPVNGLRNFGRAYAAWLTSPEWFDQELWRQTGSATLKEWLKPWEEDVGPGRFEGWGPDDLLSLAQMWQAGDVGVVGDSGGDWKEALRRVEARVLVMPAETDQYFRWEASQRELAHLKHATWACIPTVWGHIAGGGANPQDVVFMDGKIAEFLAGSGVTMGEVPTIQDTGMLAS